MESVWLKVLPRTLWCLSKLYRTVDGKIFEGIAQEAILACTDALLAAAERIDKKQGPIDASLFLVMHLLKLREQIVPFDIDFAATDISLDWHDTRAALARLVSTRAGLSPSLSPSLSPPSLARSPISLSLLGLVECWVYLCPGQTLATTGGSHWREGCPTS